jgi:hypothetical protein
VRQTEDSVSGLRLAHQVHQAARLYTECEVLARLVLVPHEVRMRREWKRPLPEAEADSEEI